MRPLPPGYKQTNLCLQIIPETLAHFCVILKAVNTMERGNSSAAENYKGVAVSCYTE